MGVGSTSGPTSELDYHTVLLELNTMSRARRSLIKSDAAKRENVDYHALGPHEAGAIVTLLRAKDETTIRTPLENCIILMRMLSRTWLFLGAGPPRELVHEGKRERGAIDTQLAFHHSLVYMYIYMYMAAS